MGLFDSCKTPSFAAHALGSLAFIFLFLGGMINLLTLSCIPVSAYMMGFSCVVGTLEAPSVMKMCETENNKNFCATFSRVIGKINGLARTVLYIFGMFPLVIWCHNVTAILTSLILVGSAFFYIAVWLGPRGGQPTDDSTREDLLTDEEREEAQGGGDVPAWARFKDDFTKKATAAVATAAVAQITEEAQEMNPFAALNQKKGPLDNTATEDDDEGNPFV
eukprot:m.32666 g.32666  ORF g.32666 m.32666 type:complete len:220 (-) comp8436_c0_seq2:91-750(-)